MINQTTHDILDRYIRNEMSEEEKHSFEIELSENQTLREELAFLKDTQTALLIQQRAQMKKKLQSFDEEDVKDIPMLFVRRKWFTYSAAASVLLLLGAWVLIIQKQPEPNIADSKSTPTIDSIKVQNNISTEAKENTKSIVQEPKNEEIKKAKRHKVVIENIGAEALGIAGTEVEYLEIEMLVSQKDTLKYQLNDNLLSIYHYENMTVPAVKKVTSDAFSGTYVQIKNQYYRIIETSKKEQLVVEKNKTRLKYLQ